MKIAVILSLFWLTLGAMCGCSKTQEENPKSDVSPQVAVTAETRQNAVASWRQFGISADSRIAVTQRRIAAIRRNLFLATPKEKVKIRRITNKAEFRLIKLEIRLQEHERRFRENVNRYTDTDLKKLESFKKEFNVKIGDIDEALNNCRCDVSDLRHNTAEPGKQK